MADCEESYDVILLDVFGSSSIPFHLVTEESCGLIASRLNPGGVVAINVEACGWRHMIVRSIAATLQEHFATVLAVPTTETADALGNVILFAGQRPFELSMEEEEVFNNPHWSQRFVPDTQGVRVLTDDLNPVGLWSEETNHVARRELHDYFEDGQLSW